MKKKVVAIMGKAGSGKDTLMRGVVNQHPDIFNELVSCTSRPPREGEKDGVNYHFYSKEEFESKLYTGELLEFTKFTGWYYGTPTCSLVEDKVNIGVFNPAGVKQLIGNLDLDVHVFYVQASDKARLMRQLTRENNPDVREILRRYGADNRDFSSSNLDTIWFTALKNERPNDFQACVSEVSGRFC